MWYLAALGLVCSYLLGNLNGAVIVSSIYAHDDVRTHGSGNAGLTNFFRNYGKATTLLVLLVDMGKTALACYAGGLMLAPFGYYQEGLMLGAVAVSLGHDFPVLLGFRGGKGILCGLTVALVIDWRIGLIILGVFIVAFAITRYVSLGSVLGGLFFALGFAFFYYNNIYILVGGVFLGLLAVWMHRANILRLIRGEETKTHLIHRELNNK